MKATNELRNPKGTNFVYFWRADSNRQHKRWKLPKAATNNYRTNYRKSQTRQGTERSHSHASAERDGYKTIHDRGHWDDGQKHAAHMDKVSLYVYNCYIYWQSKLLSTRASTCRILAELTAHNNRTYNPVQHTTQNHNIRATNVHDSHYLWHWNWCCTISHKTKQTPEIDRHSMKESRELHYRRHRPRITRYGM